MDIFLMCPICRDNKAKLARVDEYFSGENIYLYCKICKKEIPIQEAIVSKKSLRAK